jgi:DNA primase
MPYVDFAELKTRVTIEQVAATLPLKWETKGGQMRATCPVHGGDRGLIVTPAKQLFICMAEKRGGDCIQLYAHVKGCNAHEAATAIERQFGTVTDNSHSNSTVSKKQATAPQKPEAGANRPSFDPIAYAARLDSKHEALATLNLSAGTLANFKAGYASTGLNRGRVALPIHDQQGNIVAFCGRALDDKEPRLVFPSNFAPENYVFNWHNVKDMDVVYLCRDPLDVLRAAEGGVENAIAALGVITPTFLQVLSLWMEERNIQSLEPM